MIASLIRKAASLLLKHICVTKGKLRCLASRIRGCTYNTRYRKANLFIGYRRAVDADGCDDYGKTFVKVLIKTLLFLCAFLKHPKVHVNTDQQVNFICLTSQIYSQARFVFSISVSCVCGEISGFKISTETLF